MERTLGRNTSIIRFNMISSHLIVRAFGFAGVSGLLLGAILFSAMANASTVKLQCPVFLDSADNLTVWFDQSVSPAALYKHVAVHCGSDIIAVTKIEVASDLEPRHEVVLAGTFQHALGGANWQPGDKATEMKEVQPGIFEFQANLPAGSYQYKIACGGGWNENYGVGFQANGPNLTLDVPDAGEPVLFRVDFVRRKLMTSIDTVGLIPLPKSNDVKAPSHTFRLSLARRLGPSDIVRPMSLVFDNGVHRSIFAREVLSEPDYFYNGNDLGAAYTRAATTFKVWSPVSSNVELMLFMTPISSAYRILPMRRGAAGVWLATAPGNLDGIYYQYRFTSYGSQRTAPDIYGRAASLNLQRSMVIDLSRTDPTAWSSSHAARLAAVTDATVYEIHIRDFTIDESSGVDGARRGTYLGLIASGSKVPGTTAPSGFDYLHYLGVNYVQIMPFQSFDPAEGAGYSWGYATYLFDVPEPRYAVGSPSPVLIIRQVKSMVAGLHQANIGVIMDVVYNHTMPAEGDRSPFWAEAPYYWFRTAPSGDLINESGVGNSMDDEHPMVRKYICDSLAYWTTEYHIDGFRFDLLGIFTPQTVKAISETLHRIRPDILLYGEPWTAGPPARFGKSDQRGLNVAVFNDNFRNAMRGDTNGTRPGFALGGGGGAGALQNAIAGSPDFTQSPSETINYISIHDDLSLWDKIRMSLPNDENDEKSALKFAGALVLLSQGIPVLEGGAELGRSKSGSSNSYDLGDETNRFDWKRGLEFATVSSYYRGLIAIRHLHSVFRCSTAADVQKELIFLPTYTLPLKTCAFTLDASPGSDTWRETLVIFHGDLKTAEYKLPAGPWRLAVDGNAANSDGQIVTSPDFTLQPLTAYVLYRN